MRGIKEAESKTVVEFIVSRITPVCNDALYNKHHIINSLILQTLHYRVNVLLEYFRVYNSAQRNSGF